MESLSHTISLARIHTQYYISRSKLEMRIKIRFDITFSIVKQLSEQYLQIIGFFGYLPSGRFRLTDSRPDFRLKVITVFFKKSGNLIQISPIFKQPFKFIGFLAIVFDAIDIWRVYFLYFHDIPMIESNAIFLQK